MKYLHLPIHLFEFWYPEALAFFVKTWKNLMLFLEEDLAVSLMWRLLFTPLFHDSSFVGRILSFCFRLTRVLIGLFAFVLISIILVLAAFYWFVLPILAILNIPQYFSIGFLFAGLGLFLIHITTHPHKKVWQVTEAALWEASEIKKGNLNFTNLLKNSEVLDLLKNLETNADVFYEFQIKDLETLGKKAFDLARKSVSQYIGSRHFFIASLPEIPNIDNLLLKSDLKLLDFEQALYFLEKRKQTWRRVYVWDDDFSTHHLKGVNRGWLGTPTPTLDSVSEDLTHEASSKGFPDLIREHSILGEVVNILSQTSSRNVILVASPGAGKSTFLQYLAKLIVSGDAPASLATKRVVLLDLVKLVSGVETQGELAERVKTIFEEVSASGNIIICLEEIHELGMGEVGESMNLYSLMQPYLESDTFQFLATTEADNFTRVLEKNASFARIFRKVEMPPATSIDALNILEYRSIEAERKDRVRVTFVALKEVVALAQKFVHDRVLPDSAISIFKESLTLGINGWVTRETVRKVASEMVKVPILDVSNVNKSQMLNLEAELHQRFIGQEQAVKAIADSLRRETTGLREEGRPIGSFLFVGPTGVGKTELAKTLAEVYFKTDGAFLRFDMSEFQNPESIVRLIGGQGEGGLLTEEVRNRPYALLLLDEFEKANEKILTLFLQILDDGRLTDGKGQTISFENTIIIATSNAASLLIAQGIQSGKSLDIIERQVNDELLKIFRPELVNRFDEIVLFKPLTQVELEKIVTLKLEGLKNQMKEKGYLVEFDPTLVSELAKRGFDPVLGARPLRRLIQDTLESKLSKLILENKLVKGQSFNAGVELLV